MKRDTFVMLATAVASLSVGVYAGVALVGIALVEPFGKEQQLIDVIARYNVCQKERTAEQVCFLVPVTMDKKDLNGG